MIPEFQVNFGEHLRLVGSTPAMGDWSPNEGLSLEWSAGNNWSATASLPAGPIEFKVVVIRGDGSADWEACANRGVDVPEGRGLVVTCHMGSGETHFYPASEDTQQYEDEQAMDISPMAQSTDSAATSEELQSTADTQAASTSRNFDMADVGDSSTSFNSQGGYAGAERVSIGETESDADPYGGEVLVEPLRAANAHADAQNASEPRTAAAQQAESRQESSASTESQTSSSQGGETRMSLGQMLQAWIGKILSPQK